MKQTLPLSIYLMKFDKWMKGFRKYHVWLNDLEDCFQSCKPKITFKTASISSVEFLV